MLSYPLAAQQKARGAGGYYQINAKVSSAACRSVKESLAVTGAHVVEYCLNVGAGCEPRGGLDADLDTVMPNLVGGELVFKVLGYIVGPETRL